ncbi:hypothetical protein FQA39_LY00414 [Lamprigera yunnana]|nr:hypothetical protein FQA39_LY00414 [Lamprigera yunnana]
MDLVYVLVKTTHKKYATNGMKTETNKRNRAWIMYNKLIVKNERYESEKESNEKGQGVYKEQERPAGSSKRAVDERSSESNDFLEQMRKITKTSRQKTTRGRNNSEATPIGYRGNYNSFNKENGYDA